MQNKVWEQVSQFLNRLRCENINRSTSVEIPGYKQEAVALELLREKCEILISQFSDEQQHLLLKWTETLENMNSLEGQRAYCQGYVDCILLLNGMGLFRQNLSSAEISILFSNIISS